MKKNLFLLLSLFFILLIDTPVFSAEITGKGVSGEVVSQSLALNITIIGGPALEISLPENKTYLKNESLSVNYTAGGEDTVWYNFDNTANTTITSSFFFNISQGSHTLYLFANNSYGNITSRNVIFYVNSTRFIILYNEYSDSTKGSSTDFNSSTYEDIQDLSNIILENTDWGKIEFLENVNVTDDENSGDNEVDLDTNVNISENKIEINSTALPNFNKPATLYLYNLALINPRILRDGSVCPPSICTIESYTGGALKTLKFNVTQFSVYRAEETQDDGGDDVGGVGV